MGPAASSINHTSRLARGVRRRERERGTLPPLPFVPRIGDGGGEERADEVEIDDPGMQPPQIEILRKPSSHPLSSSPFSISSPPTLDLSGGGLRVARTSSSVAHFRIGAIPSSIVVAIKSSSITAQRERESRGLPFSAKSWRDSKPHSHAYMHACTTAVYYVLVCVW